MLLPLLRADLFDALGAAPPRGVLLYGPPGVGKTTLARAAAAAAKHGAARANVIEVRCTDVVDSAVGASERAIAAVFAAARAAAPCVLLLDQVTMMSQ